MYLDREKMTVLPLIMLQNISLNTPDEKAHTKLQNLLNNKIYFTSWKIIQPLYVITITTKITESHHLGY